MQALAEIEVAMNHLKWKEAETAGPGYLTAMRWDFTVACAAVEETLYNALEAYDD